MIHSCPVNDQTEDEAVTHRHWECKWLMISVNDHFQITVFMMMLKQNPFSWYYLSEYFIFIKKLQLLLFRFGCGRIIHDFDKSSINWKVHQSTGQRHDQLVVGRPGQSVAHISASVPVLVLVPNETIVMINTKCFMCSLTPSLLWCLSVWTRVAKPH